MDKIYLNTLSFFGYHGVYEEETRLGQRFKVDVVLEADLRDAGRTDDLEKSVNYAEVFNVVQEVVEGPPQKLVERVATLISDAILNRFPLVQSCTIKVIKPDPPIPGHYDSVAVEITRARQ